MARTGFVAQIGLRVSFPFPQTDLAYCLCDRYAKSGVAVEDGDADLDFRDLPFEVPRHERLTRKFQTMHFRFVSTRLRRWYPLQRRHSVRPRYRCALTASLRAIAPALVGFQGLAFLRGGITRMGISGGNRLVAFTGVIRPVCGDTADVLIRGDLIE
jgi:hypothetical protein